MKPFSTPSVRSMIARTAEGLNGLIIDGSGNLFGNAAQGSGKRGRGVVFELQNNAGSWSEVVLHKFCESPKCSDGAYGWQRLLPDAAGDLLGVTLWGGTGKRCCGVLFQLTPQGVDSPYNVLASFCEKRNCTDGAQPSSDLVMDTSGNLFGATETGGRYRTDQGHLGGGTVFQWTGSTLETLYSFCKLRDCADGEYPIAGLVNGRLWQSVRCNPVRREIWRGRGVRTDALIAMQKQNRAGDDPARFSFREMSRKRGGLLLLVALFFRRRRPSWPSSCRRSPSSARRQGCRRATRRSPTSRTAPRLPSLREISRALMESEILRLALSTWVTSASILSPLPKRSGRWSARSRARSARRMNAFTPPSSATSMPPSFTSVTVTVTTCSS